MHVIRRKSLATFLTGVRPSLIAGLAAFSVYLATIAPDLTWANFGGDGGELITAAVTLGVPHPPGYPTYVLLGKLASFIPIGNIAFRFNLLSAISVAVAAAFVTAIAGHRLAGADGHEGAPIYVGLLFAFTPLVWGQAVITEVYGLNLAFLAACLWLLLSGRSSGVTGLLLGLSITTHLTSLLLLPLTLLLTPRNRWLQLCAGMLVGLSPLLALPWLAGRNGPLPWHAAVHHHGWWWLLSGELYQGNVMGLPAAELGSRLQRWIATLWRQFGWFALPVLLGDWLTATGGTAGRAHTFTWYQRHPALPLTVTALAYIIYAIGYSSRDAIIFLLPALLILSILLTPGIRRLGPIALLLPLLSVGIHFNMQNLRGDMTVRRQAEQLLREAPMSAILLTPGDPAVFALWYFHYVEEQRPDILLVDGNLYTFDWYRRHLARHYPHLTHLKKDELDAFRRANEQQPICSVSRGLSLRPCTSEVN